MSAGILSRSEDNLQEYYNNVLSEMMRLILARYERNERYGWIDTKFNIRTGEDFSDSDQLRGRSCVYSWIQGRGVESLLKHADWFELKGILVPQADLLRNAALKIAGRIRAARKKNGGHIPFFMDPDGNRYIPSAMQDNYPGKDFFSGKYTTSDMFAARALFSAASETGETEALNDAALYLRYVLDSISSGIFVTDQAEMSTANPVMELPGRSSQSSRMLGIGAASLMVDHGFNEGIDYGKSSIRYLLNNHIFYGDKGPASDRICYTEYIDAAGSPWESGGAVLSDPGHAIEFSGLCLGFLRKAEAADSRKLSDEFDTKNIKTTVKELFRNSFEWGYNLKHGGIYKLIDLNSLEPVNGTMPWWSLPECMRTASECILISDTEAEQEYFAKILSTCHRAFSEKYIQGPLCGHFAVQTRNSEGCIVDSIPAVPDADPGFHTGLSLIDVMTVFHQQKE